MVIPGGMSARVASALDSGEEGPSCFDECAVSSMTVSVEEEVNAGVLIVEPRDEASSCFD